MQYFRHSEHFLHCRERKQERKAHKLPLHFVFFFNWLAFSLRCLLLLVSYQINCHTFRLEQVLSAHFCTSLPYCKSSWAIYSANNCAGRNVTTVVLIYLLYLIFNLQLIICFFSYSEYFYSIFKCFKIQIIKIVTTSTTNKLP